MKKTMRNRAVINSASKAWLRRDRESGSLHHSAIEHRLWEWI